MNETTDNLIPEGKIYKDKAFWAGTFIGGPLVAGYLFSKNFKSLGQPEKVKPTWIITIISTLVIFGGIFLIPENINIPNQIIPIAYTAIAFSLFKKYLAEKTTEHIKIGGLVHSWWRVTAVGIIGLLITTLPIFAFAYTYDAIEQANTSTKSYGQLVKNEIDFDKSNIAEHEVDRIADGFIATGFFDLSYPKYVYAAKNGEKYEISIAVIEGMEKNTDELQPFIELRSQMDAYFPYNDIKLKLVVYYLDNVVKVLK